MAVAWELGVGRRESASAEQIPNTKIRASRGDSLDEDNLIIVPI
jgi:hypothetical protein